MTYKEAFKEGIPEFARHLKTSTAIKKRRRLMGLIRKACLFVKKCGDIRWE